jgi:hypothetical protein
MPPEKRVIRVYVFKDDGLFDSYKVYPPVVILRANDKFEDAFQIVNAADEAASWVAPDVLEEEDKVGIPDNAREEIKPGTPSKKWKVRIKKLVVVEYEIKIDGHKVKGNSDPRIIIDP